MACAALAAPTLAAKLVSASPEGEAKQVRQVALVFSDPMAPQGDPGRVPAPVTVACDGPDLPKGSGRWLDERRWVWEFERPLPGGARCTLAWRADLKDAAGQPVTGQRPIAFRTGGPSVVSTQPWLGSRIEEHQHFVLRLDSAVDVDSIARGAWCQADKLAERLPLEVVERDPQAKGRPGGDLPPGWSVTVRCKRPLPADSVVTLVWGKGVTTANGMARSADQRLRYTIRPAFTASFSCERPKADAPCLPLTPMTVNFTAPVPRAQAAAIRLAGGGKDIAPALPDDAESVDSVSFAGPLPERTEFRVTLPAALKDDSGRALANAALFPLKVATGPLPPLAKFPVAPFGIIELDDATLPITLRNVEPDLLVRGHQPTRAASASSVRVTDEAQVLAWMRRLRAYDERAVQTGTDRKGQAIWTESRTLSLLGPNAKAVPADVRRIALPAGPSPRPFEVVGLPLDGPGYHVVEVESTLLGRALLDREAPMYVRTGMLVTNLAVHLKIGAENGLVWVTALDTGRPVAEAQVKVLECDGAVAWEGRTDPLGRALVPEGKLRHESCDASGEDDGGRMVSVRKTDAKGRADFSFAMTGWTGGIEPWRFNLPTTHDERDGPVMRLHSILDRTLLRAGETLSMKHLARLETMGGLARASRERLPDTLRIVHVGSGQQFTQTLAWSADARHALSTFRIPKDAKLGLYQVFLVKNRQASQSPGADDGSDAYWGDAPSAAFRVEEFRLPVLTGRVAPPAGDQVAVTQVPVDVQLRWQSGGPAARLPVRVSGLLRPRTPVFADWDEYVFSLREEGDAAPEGRLVADKLPVTLDAQGAGRATIDGLKVSPQPQDLVVEATFDDPNGETQTLSTTVPLYPASVLVGMKVRGWASAGDGVPVQTVVLDPRGRPQAKVPVEVVGVQIKRTTTRKRLVGGLYAYDTQEQRVELGVLCKGESDAAGRFECAAKVADAGQVRLVARARDAQGRVAQADASAWITGRGEVWFDLENQDRIDLLPEKKRYRVGETARLQVRMPFRHATALVAIEREGVVSTQVVELRGSDPTISVPITASHAPNVYVTVLAVRGRVREVPWYSLFTWGWRSPSEWWTARRNAADFAAPTALVDLGKPAYKFGAAELRVDSREKTFDVAVSTDRDRYAVRETAKATVRVSLAGKPAPAGTEIALVAVDQALLDLMPNATWAVMDALMQRRSWSVTTATAQMQVVGKRHYGKKAAPPGGDGGRAPTRELFDTLLLWKAVVALDERGEARVDVPLNDALTTFRIVAIADAGGDLFGTGSTTIRSSQDLQIAPGLPPLVREDDRYVAMVTLRNTTDKPMNVRFAADGPAGAGHRRELVLPPGESQEVNWDVRVPADAGGRRIDWTLSAQDAAGRASDRTRVSQQVVAAVPVTVMQGTLVQVDGRRTLPIQAPAGALPDRGGVSVTLQSRLASGLPGVLRWFENYPYACLEQKTSKSIGLRDLAKWRATVEAMPAYLDADGLAAYFPVDAARGLVGSDTLTAYLLSASDEAARLDPAWALPDAVREQMERGLIAFVEGRIRREHWSPVRDVPVRRLAALEALSRGKRLTPALLDTVDPSDLSSWPASAVLDWWAVLLRTPAAAQREARLEAAERQIRARLSFEGDRLVWNRESDDNWWWLMASGDANAAKLLSLAVDLPSWKDDSPRLALGLLGRMQRGAWITTNANLLGSLAIDRFSDRFERTPVAGQSAAVVRAADGREQARAIDWPAPAPGAGALPSASAAAPSAAVATLPDGTARRDPAIAGVVRPQAAGTMTLGWPGADRGVLALAHVGDGKPWATVQLLAATPLTSPRQAGFKVERKLEPVSQRVPGSWSRGDTMRVTLTVTPMAAGSWVVVDDPIPSGATILGSGLGRDSQIAARPADASPAAAWSGARMAYEERGFEAMRIYYAYVPARPFTAEYTVRLNNPGEFRLPPTRVEAMYNPAMYAMTPNAPVTVKP